MNLSEFYNAVVPADDGKLILAFLSNKGMQHVVCNDHAELQKATIKAAKSGFNVFYAMGSYQQGWHENPKTGKNQLRTRDNVHQIKALWFDIDFKGGLSNPTEVVAALREFCNATRMPAPSILVHSGNGIHVYWPLEVPIARSRWEELARALKNEAAAHGLPADPTCTADPARVLRPVGTRNLKDSNDPKAVKALHWSGKLFDPRDLEAALLGTGGASGQLDIHGNVPDYLRGLHNGLTELSNGVAGRTVESFVPNIAKKCGVLAHVLQTNGEDCSEPEWVACLQLAKHCADGELYYHALSEGHPDYTPEDTTEKWNQRLENDAGPTLCDTFASFRPEVCKACPHRGSVKTPLSLGEEEVVTAEGKEFPLKTWRPIEGDLGMERKMFDPGTKQFLWEKVLNRTWEMQGASRDIVSNQYNITVASRLAGSTPISIEMDARLLGDTVSLKKELASNGCPLEQPELVHWNKLMSTWLQEIQKKRQVGNAVSRLGWIEQRTDDENTKIIGFTAGTTSFMANGTKEAGVRVASKYREIARHYQCNGDFENWKESADFVADQNNPAFTTILASAFAAPLFGFTGMPGAMLTIVSNESGLGKSSVLKTAQAVWGSPTKGMNSTSDTYLSIINKTAFLKNLPVYWDEIRGEGALENFYKTAFDIAQGKERTRLTTNAELREVADWKTMVIGASNESIFDYMGGLGGASDAATARTFEVEVDPFNDPTRASRNAMFGLLDSNYGHAGLRFAEYISTKHGALEQAVQKTYQSLYADHNFREGERFWCATIAALLVGAAVAKKAGIVSIDTKTLKRYLLDRVTVLRTRTGHSLAAASARELVIAYLQQHQADMMVVDQFPKPGRYTKDPVILQPSKTGKLMIIKGENDTYRFTVHDFHRWLKASHNISFSSIEKQFKNEISGTMMYTIFGIGANSDLPRTRLYEVQL